MSLPHVPRSAGWHVEAFFREYLRHTKGRWAGSPVVCEPWQRYLLDELFALDRDRRRVYTDATVGIPRKNSKSTMCAGIGLYLLGPDGENGPEVYISAGSADQAGVVFGQASDFVEANPDLADWFVTRQYRILCPATNGFMRRLAADGRLNHGLNPHGVILDELHAFTSPRQVANYEAMTTACAARDQPLTIAITTAGDDPESILGRLYTEALDSPNLERVGGPDRERLKAGLSVLRDPDTGRIFIWWGADQDADIENPEVWRAANPASWVSVEYLRRQFASPNVSETTFRKLHLNQFVNAREAWLPYGTWAGLVSRLPVPRRIAVGVDVGLTQDTTAVAWAGPDPETGRIVTRAHVWSARGDVPHHTFVPGGRVDLGLVEEFIRGLAREHVVDRILYDPRMFERSAQLLDGEGFTVAPLHQSSAPMADAYHEFYVDARTGLTTHDGDPVLAAHVDATAGVKTERGWRVSKLRSNKRIDACVAAAMAQFGARRLDEVVQPWAAVW